MLARPCAADCVGITAPALRCWANSLLFTDPIPLHTMPIFALLPLLPVQHHQTSTLPQVSQVQIDDYEVKLRMPDSGIYAGEPLDLEFRVTDTRQKDPVENGFKGVGGITATAKVTMPSMQGMPEMRPKVHREGVPGDYGLELFFPHGGIYQIDLSLKLPGVETPKAVTFRVAVKDERPAGSKVQAPYKLRVLPPTSPRVMGKSTELQMQVVNTKTGQVEKAFDEAHTQKFHLLIASQDLNWFRHEHPVMAPDGTWKYSLAFPAGTDYLVFGDVAPQGQGSRILASRVSVKGTKPTWNTRIALNSQSTDNGLKGLFSSANKVKSAQSAVLQVKLFDSKTGMAAGDTKPWLGAAGHMMIFHTDGKTVVHSHPQEDAESEELVRKGIVRFSARFPKPGTYKVYSQFSWRGSIRTLSFGLKVQE